MANSGRALRTKRRSVSFLDKADSTNSNAFVAACTCGQPEQPWCSIDDLTHILYVPFQNQLMRAEKALNLKRNGWYLVFTQE
jgi:hypothetical protein